MPGFVPCLQTDLRPGRCAGDVYMRGMVRVCFGLVLLAASVAAEPLSWHKMLEDATAEANRNGKPILAYVFDDY